MPCLTNVVLVVDLVAFVCDEVSAHTVAVPCARRLAIQPNLHSMLDLGSHIQTLSNSCRKNHALLTKLNTFLSAECAGAEFEPVGSATNFGSRLWNPWDSKSLVLAMILLDPFQ